MLSSICYIRALQNSVHVGSRQWQRCCCGFASANDIAYDLFLKRCRDLVERRGHRFIHLGEQRVDNKGKITTFDITYGWPIKYYCKCNFSDNPVQSRDIKRFEKQLKSCGIIPTRGVFFSKSCFVSDDLDFDVFCIDPTSYSTLYKDGVKDRFLHAFIYLSIFAAFCMLRWSFYDEHNIRKKQLMRLIRKIRDKWKGRHNQSELSPSASSESVLLVTTESDVPVISECDDLNTATLANMDTISDMGWNEWINSYFWSLFGYK